MIYHFPIKDVFIYMIYLYILYVGLCKPHKTKNIYIYKVSVWSLEASFAKLFCATSIALQL